EMDRLAAQNRTELLNQTAKEYAQEMKSLQNFGDNISSLAQQRKINELVARATQLHTEVLSNVYKKVPEQAQSAIKRAMNRSVTGHRMAVKSLDRTGGVPSDIGGVSEHIPSGLQGKMGGPTNIPTAGQGTGGDQNGTGGQAPGTPTGY
ncbi:MAG: hypothetical protein SVU32_03405, partial [Candidatus Nanohaloarchaea archaeon]|nr:hypothetical protein [Candidatus Nanohaloarchaea archaeon]